MQRLYAFTAYCRPVNYTVVWLITHSALNTLISSKDDYFSRHCDNEGNVFFFFVSGAKLNERNFLPIKMRVSTFLQAHANSTSISH